MIWVFVLVSSSPKRHQFVERNQAARDKLYLGAVKTGIFVPPKCWGWWGASQPQSNLGVSIGKTCRKGSTREDVVRFRHPVIPAEVGCLRQVLFWKPKYFFRKCLDDHFLIPSLAAGSLACFNCQLGSSLSNLVSFSGGIFKVGTYMFGVGKKTARYVSWKKMCSILEMKQHS